MICYCVVKKSTLKDTENHFGTLIYLHKESCYIHIKLKFHNIITSYLNNYNNEHYIIATQPRSKTKYNKITQHFFRINFNEKS